MAHKSTKRGTLDQRLDRALSELTGLEKRAARKPVPTVCHDFRTASRRLRGVLAVFDRSLPRDTRTQVEREARHLTRLPARVRDLDVALDMLETLKRARASKDEQRAFADAREAWQRRRARQAHKLRRELDDKRPVHQLARLLRNLSDTPRRAPRAARSKTEVALLAHRHHVAECLDRAVNDQTSETVHELRVAVKTYRNALLAARDLVPDQAGEETLAFLKRVQDVLGAHHDYAELQRLLQKRRHKAHRHEHTALAEGYDRLIARARKHEQDRFRTFMRRFRDRLSLLVAPHVVAAAAPTAPAFPAPANTVAVSGTA